MNDNRIHDRDNEQRNSDDDMLRSKTMNETIREASGNPDADMNNDRSSGSDSGRASDYDSEGMNNADQTSSRRGMNWSPNDASGVRSGGTADMDNQTSSGAGLNTGRRTGSGSGLEPKTGITGSDFDGQNASS